jgi:uncharacterized protein (DUF1800 family)
MEPDARERVSYVHPASPAVADVQNAGLPAASQRRILIVRSQYMNRRDFLTVRSRGLSAGSHGGAQTPSAVHARRSDTGLTPYAGPWEYPQAAHLLRRAMVGPRHSEITQAVSNGMSATVALLLEPFTPDATGIEGFAGQDPRIRPPRDPVEAQAFQQLLQQNRERLVRWQMRTVATSPVSIQERMVLLWMNHFTSELEVVNFAEFMHGQNVLIRRFALGNFKEFTRAITKDMAMLIYLDGLKNFKTGGRSNINENYSRELMELFTMGVTDWSEQPNYTETDVVEGARSLTGYVAKLSTKGLEYIGLESEFSAVRWDAGQKTYLGRTGAWDTDDVIDIIFEVRADQTAKFVCEKLYRAFVYDIPDRVVITEMAELFRASNWEIRPVVEALLKSAHFYDVTNVGALEKSPADYMLGMVRGLGLGNVPDFPDVATVNRFTRDLATRMGALGQIFFDPPNVKGWPGGRTWISTSTLPPRQKFALDVIDGRLVGANRQRIYTFDIPAFVSQIADFEDAEAIVDGVTPFLLNSPPSEKERQMLLETLLNGSPVYEWPNLDESQRVDRTELYLKALVQLAKFQLT